MANNNILIIIIIVATIFVGMQYFDSPRAGSYDELDYDPTSMTFSRGERVEYPYPSWADYGGEYDDLDVTGDGTYDIDDYEELVYGPYADYGYYGKYGYPEENACGYPTYGYPDYIGTNKEGDTCTDALQSENDLECLSNPPINYDGEINLMELSSSPKITCCVADGTCHWYK